MTATVPAPTARPGGIDALVERFEPSVIDVPGGRARIRLSVTDGDDWDVTIKGHEIRLKPAREDAHPDAVITADSAAWRRVAGDLRGGMAAFRAGRLNVRHNLHLGVGFLAATSGNDEPGRLRFARVKTKTGGISTIQAGVGDPVVAIHGLGGTKASFMPTIAALAEHHRVIALDLPGFGDSVKPIGAPYDAPWLARVVTETLDALSIERAHLAGNSMGGRVALELGMIEPDRTGQIVLLAPAMAWLRERRWAPVVRLLRPELGLLQVAPRPVVEGIVRRLIPGATEGWTAAGVDEFLRAFLTPRGRAAFYACLRNIYLDEPHGENGFWTRLRELSPETMFIWGKQDTLIPTAFRKHVERELPAARHIELNCGHVPQVEAPGPVHAAMRKFFAARPL